MYARIVCNATGNSLCDSGFSFEQEGSGNNIYSTFVPVIALAIVMNTLTTCFTK